MLGVMGFAAVLCLWFPALLTTPELRQVYDMTLMRALIAWPTAYDIAGDPVPEGYLRQRVYPFIPKKPAAGAAAGPATRRA